MVYYVLLGIYYGVWFVVLLHMYNINMLMYYSIIVLVCFYGISIFILEVLFSAYRYVYYGKVLFGTVVTGLVYTIIRVYIKSYHPRF